MSYLFGWFFVFKNSYKNIRRDGVYSLAISQLQPLTPFKFHSILYVGFINKVTK